MAKAVVLLNLGGPDSLEAVQPFLMNLFTDPDIFKLPAQQKLAKFISEKRAPKVQNEYLVIGGKSPINEWTELQRKNLESSLRKIESDIDVHVAMRYWHPLTDKTAEIVDSKNYDKIILLPLYPHYSLSTTGSSFNEWKRKSKSLDKTVYVQEYYCNPTYIKSISERIDEGLQKFSAEDRGKVVLLFSAHGTPLSYVKKGDPYSKQIEQTVKAVMAFRDDEEFWDLSFQSKVGPMRWLKPATDEKIEELAKAGYKHLLVIPISFVSDHVETLYELGVEYQHVAKNCGIQNYIVMTGLNDSTTFIDALVDEVKKVL